jgi:translocation and assembly module TamB
MGGRASVRFVKYFLVCVLFAVLGIIYSRELPKLKTWLLVKIQVLSKQKTPFEVKAAALNFKILPPGIELAGVRLQPNSPLNQSLAPVTANSISVYMSGGALFAGRFEIGTVSIEHPVVNAIIMGPENKTTSAPSKSTELPWDEIMRLPVRRVEINDAEVRADLRKSGVLIQLQRFALNIQKTFNAARIEVFAPELAIKRKGFEESLTQFGLATRLIAEKEALEVSALKLSQGKSFVIARGVARGPVTKLEWGVVNGRMISHLNLEEIYAFMKTIFPSVSLPELKGDLNLEILARHQRGRTPLLSADVELLEAKIDQFQLGNIRTKIKYSADVLRTDEVSIQTTAGKFILQDVDLKLGKEIKISTRVMIDNVELRQLLINLGVGDTPLHLLAKGRIPCEGSLHPQILIQCAGELHGSKFRVHTEPEDKTIVALDRFSIMSTMTLQKDKVSFPHGIITIGESRGEGRGYVDFEKGFNFSYSSPHLDFKDITSLADLKYQGAVEIAGTTLGRSRFGIIDAQIRTKDFWFEDYAVGNTTGQLRYENSVLHLNHLDGNIGETSYRGNARIMLKDTPPGSSGIQAKLDIPKFEMTDLVKVFSRKVNLPFTATGNGKATLDVSGPFSLSKLTYTLKSSLNQGMIAGEIVKDVKFNVHAEKGHVFSDDISLKKGDGNFQMTGDVLPNGQMNLKVWGRELHLTDFEYSKVTAPGLDGKLDATLDLKEFILRPHVTLQAHVSNTMVNQKPLDDSHFNAVLNQETLRVKAGVFNKKLHAELVLPLQENNPFSLKFETAGWDFSNLLGIITGNDVKHDYETSVTGSIDLSSAKGGFWNSSGLISFNDFYVRHGTAQMRNNKPISIRFNEGQIAVERLQIDGDNTQLGVTGGKNKKNQLNFNVNGHIDLSLLTFLTPFFKDMSGQLSLSTQIGGTSLAPDLLGSAFISKGFFKLAELPHPFEDINADLLFSQSRVIVNRLKGIFAGGQLTGGGSVAFRAFRDIPVELTGDLRQATLNIPEGLTTKGNVHFTINGNWFPFLLKANYAIESGIYAKNFGEEVQANLIRRSNYLPKLILQKDFTPIEVDIYAHFPKGVAVKNDLMEAEARGELQIKGDPRHSTLKGEIEAVPNGKIFFRETPFNINAGRIRFTGAPENNPVVYALATTRVRDWDISLLVQGTVQKPRIELTSLPALSEQSIVSLLALGMTDEGLEKEQSTDQLAMQAGAAGSLLFSQNPLQNELKKKLGVNVRLSQKVDDTKNVSTTSVIAEKQWTPQISTSVSRTIGTDRSSRNFDVEYKLNRHFSVLGSYEGRDFDNLSTSTTPQQSAITQDIFGLDLQYQVEFK